MVATPQTICRAPAAADADVASDICGPPPLTCLAGHPGGPYFVLTSWLDATELCRLDAACRLLRELNELRNGPWRVAGRQAFAGVELEAAGGFAPFEDAPSEGESTSAPTLASAPHSEGVPEGWKKRYEVFRQLMPTFSEPFGGSEIAVVRHADEVAYCRCRLRTDLLALQPERGFYVEVEVRRNADNLSLAVVDFEGGGRSSVTFSPETGAVLRERKVREAPRAIEGTYINLLSAAPVGQRFEGSMGLYFRAGHLAFFRRWSVEACRATAAAERDEIFSASSEDGVRGANALGGPASAGASTASTAADAIMGGREAPPGYESTRARFADSGGAAPPWETTGFCTDLHWAEGRRLSICLAFRDDGPYLVRIVRVGTAPPAPPEQSSDAYQEDRWNSLYGDDSHPLAI